MIRRARYSPSRRFVEGIDMTLKHLPKRLTVKQKALRATGIAAAIALLLGFAAPPIVRAASQLIDRLFSDRIQKIEAYQALPEDEKLQKSIQEIEDGMRAQPAGGSAEFMGVTITLPSFTLSAAYDDETGEPTGAGSLSARIEFSEIPGFDPNYLDMELRVGGNIYPMDMGEGTARYRQTGKKATTIEGWRDEDFSMYCDAQIREGVPTCYMSFPVPEWRLTEVTEFELVGSLDGQSFAIPFTFDPALAHAYAVQMAKEDVVISEQMKQEDKEEYQALAQASAPVGLSGSANGYDYTISDIALVDNKLHIGLSAQPASAGKGALDRLDLWIEDTVVDGMSTIYGGGGGKESREGGVVSLSYYTPMGRDLTRLPEQSLICLKIALGAERAYAAFRFNWDEKKAALPADAKEMRAWVDESKALAEALNAKSRADLELDLSPMHLAQTVNGLTMTLKKATLWDGDLLLDFGFDRDFKAAGQRLVRDFDEETTLLVNGAPATITSHGSGSIQAGLPLHRSEIGDALELALRYPFRILDINDKEVEKGVFEIGFALDVNAMTKMPPSR